MGGIVDSSNDASSDVSLGVSDMLCDDNLKMYVVDDMDGLD
jgi:hypothetical protein